MSKIDKYSKALVGALVAGLGTLEMAMVDNVVSSPEWVRIGAVTLASLGLIWGSGTGKDPKLDPKDPDAAP